MKLGGEIFVESKYASNLKCSFDIIGSNALVFIQHVSKIEVNFRCMDLSLSGGCLELLILSLISGLPEMRFVCCVEKDLKSSVTALLFPYNIFARLIYELILTGLWIYESVCSTHAASIGHSIDPFSDSLMAAFLNGNQFDQVKRSTFPVRFLAGLSCTGSHQSLVINFPDMTKKRGQISPEADIAKMAFLCFLKP